MPRKRNEEVSEEVDELQSPLIEEEIEEEIEEVPITAELEDLPPFVPPGYRAVPIEDAEAYWLSGRPAHIARRLLHEHSDVDSTTAVVTYYIPK